jgi:hypothetical protein
MQMFELGIGPPKAVAQSAFDMTVRLIHFSTSLVNTSSSSNEHAQLNLFKSKINNESYLDQSFPSHWWSLICPLGIVSLHSSLEGE